MTTAMTALRSTDDRLRTVLRVDGVVTGLAGLLALASPLTWYGDPPGWLVRTVGVVLLVAGVDLALLSRAQGRLLRVGVMIAAELAFAWVAATIAVLALVDLPAQGVEVLALVGVVTLGFGLTYVRLRR